MWIRNRYAILFVNISLISSFKDFRTNLRSLASNIVKAAHATYSPYVLASKAGSFSLSSSLTFLILSISLEFLQKLEHDKFLLVKIVEYSLYYSVPGQALFNEFIGDLLKLM